MIVLDANVLIAWLDPGDSLHERALTDLDEAAAEPLGAATLTLAEVLVGPARAGRLQAAYAALADLGVSEIALDGEAVTLATLRVETDRRLPDCCVLAAAQLTHAGAILTFDRKLAGAARLLGLRLLDEP